MQSSDWLKDQEHNRYSTVWYVNDRTQKLFRLNEAWKKQTKEQSKYTIVRTNKQKKLSSTSPTKTGWKQTVRLKVWRWWALEHSISESEWEKEFAYSAAMVSTAPIACTAKLCTRSRPKQTLSSSSGCARGAKLKLLLNMACIKSDVSNSKFSQQSAILFFCLLFLIT